ncbi:MAG: hypothetical protein RJB08_1942 [Actinomycetota bacterium]
MSRIRGVRVLLALALGLAGLLVTPSVPVVSAAPACDSTGANCKVGDTGPGGGIIFYDAGSQQWWGRFLEAKQDPIQAGVPISNFGSGLSLYGQNVTQAIQRRSMAIGMGAENTRLLGMAGSQVVARHFSASEDWFLPSKDELDALYNSAILPNSSRWKVPVWSSSESETGFVWYQLFQDGTQFTDAQGIIPKLKSNVGYVNSAKHVGSDYEPLPMHIIKVRAFPAPTGPVPSPSLVTSVRDNPFCWSLAVNCQIGDKGPAGGIIVYDAGSDQSWGRYLEIAPQSCEIERVAFNPSNAKPSLYATSQDRMKAKAIGMGRTNTTLLASKFDGAARVADNSTCNNYGDWFLPSKDELNEAFRQLSHSRKGLQLTPVGGFDRGYYWTSSDYNGSTAWTQYFADGQQFDRVQTLSANKQPPARPFRVRPMRAFKTGQVSTGSVSLPADSVTKTITITCERTTVSGKPGITCDGAATGFAAGSAFIPYVRFPGETAYTPGSARPLTDASGNFTWSRKTGKKVYVYVTSSDGEVNSNRVIVSAN